jgi:hypothetical protein
MNFLLIMCGASMLTFSLIAFGFAMSLRWIDKHSVTGQDIVANFKIAMQFAIGSATFLFFFACARAMCFLFGVELQN